MSDFTLSVRLETTAGDHVVITHTTPPTAVADGPVSDTAEPFTAEPGGPVSELYGDDTDTVAHG